MSNYIGIHEYQILETILEVSYERVNGWKLKFSVPEFINSDLELNKLIISIKEADIEDGGEGAILIRLKNL